MWLLYGFPKGQARRQPVLTPYTRLRSFTLRYWFTSAGTRSPGGTSNASTPRCRTARSCSARRSVDSCAANPRYMSAVVCR